MEQAVNDDMMSDLPKGRMARYATRALRTGKRAEDVDYDRLRRIFGGVSEETVNKTLAATTHMVQRPTNKNGKHTTDLPMLRLHWVPCANKMRPRSIRACSHFTHI